MAQLVSDLVICPPLALPDLSDQDKNRRKVLLVEDNESNMQVISGLLEAAGYKPLHAVSAEEAIEKAAGENPALILMDISLPGLDGLTATKVLKSKPATAHIPVVALTAHAMKDDAGEPGKRAVTHIYSNQ